MPPDANRLLKDYYHDKRLTDYNIGPNSVWGWGHYNGLGGWSFAGYLGSLHNPKERKYRTWGWFCNCVWFLAAMMCGRARTLFAK